MVGPETRFKFTVYFSLLYFPSTLNIPLFSLRGSHYASGLRGVRCGATSEQRLAAFDEEPSCCRAQCRLQAL